MTTSREALLRLPRRNVDGMGTVVSLGEVLEVLAAEPGPLDVERLDRVVDELRERGYTIPEASTIASTYARLATEDDR